MVYEGILQKISTGSVIDVPTGGYWTNNMSIGRFHQAGGDAQNGWTRREFVDIGDTRILGIVLHPLHDALLVEAVGKEIALSITPPQRGRRTVVAIRTPDGGLNRPPLGRMLFASTWLVTRTVVAAVILGLLMTLFAAVVVAIVTGSDSTGAATGPIIGIAFGALLVLRMVIRVSQSLRARTALG